MMDTKQLDNYILEFTHDQDGSFFDFTIWASEDPIKEDGRITERKLKEYYNFKDWGYWSMALPDQTDIIDGSTPFEDFISNAFDHEIEALLKSYLLEKNLI